MAINPRRSVHKSNATRSKLVSIVLLGSLFVALLVPYTDLVGGLTSYLPSAVLLIPVLLLTLFRNTTISFDRNVLLFFVVIYGVYLIHYLRAVFHYLPTSSLAGSPIVRAPVFIVSSVLAVFVIPHTFSFEDFYDSLYIVSIGTALVGLPTVFVSKYTLIGVTISQFSQNSPLLMFSAPILSSVFSNPNIFGIFSSIGLLIGFSKVFRGQWGSTTVAIPLLTLAVLLSRSRTAYVATLVGLLVVGSRKKTRIDLSWIVYAVVFGVFMFSGFVVIVEQPGQVLGVSLSGRKVLWDSVLSAVLAKPVLGHGPFSTTQILGGFLPKEQVGKHAHNSYLRLFLTTGVIGGVSYFALTVYTAIVAFGSRYSADDYLLLSLLSGLAVFQLFESFSLFGLSILSFVAASVYGYVLHVDST